MRKLEMDELNRLDLERFKSASKNNFCIILDNVRSLNNVGSAFRTGDAFLTEAIHLCGITGTPPDREIHKTALGATETVAWTHHKNTLDLIVKLKQENWKIYAIEQVEPKIYLQDFKPVFNEKYAFVFGNEVHGVDEAIFPYCDGCIEIPQFGSKHSLNISVSIGIIAWDFLSKTALNVL